MQVTISGLFSYPVKSLRGQAQQRLTLGASGLRGDRRWMVVDRQGGFITQRQVPAMAALTAELTAEGLRLSTDATDSVLVQTPDVSGPRLTVQVWQDSCAALAVAARVDDWLSARLDRACRLVYMPPTTHRQVSGYDQNLIGFADGYPLLLTSTASLGELNRRMTSAGAEAVPMSRFRPNLVVTANGPLAPFAEDEWASLSLGERELINAKPCGRCMVITTDQQSGERQRDREPMNTLKNFRTDAQGEVLFGINLVPRMQHQSSIVCLAIGDQLSVNLR